MGRRTNKKQFPTTLSFMFGVILAFGSAYFLSQLVPIALQVKELVNQGVPLNGTAALTIVLLLLSGTTICALQLTGQMFLGRFKKALSGDAD